MHDTWSGPACVTYIVLANSCIATNTNSLKMPGACWCEKKPSKSHANLHASKVHVKVTRRFSPTPPLHAKKPATHQHKQLCSNSSNVLQAWCLNQQRIARLNLVNMFQRTLHVIGNHKNPWYRQSYACIFSTCLWSMYPCNFCILQSTPLEKEENFSRERMPSLRGRPRLGNKEVVPQTTWKHCTNQVPLPTCASCHMHLVTHCIHSKESI